MDLLILIIFKAIDIYIWLMIIGIAMGWLMTFGVLNGNNKYVEKAYRFLHERLIDPVLEPIRRVIPSIGGIDISPIVAIIGFQLLQQLLIRILYS